MLGPGVSTSPRHNNAKANKVDVAGKTHSLELGHAAVARHDTSIRRENLRYACFARPHTVPAADLHKKRVDYAREAAP